MISPESDWTPHIPAGVDQFKVHRRMTAEGMSADIRSFKWVAPEAGPLSPQKHFIDMSLARQQRSSSLRCGDWRGERRPGDMLYLPPGQTYMGLPAQEQRHLLCIGLSSDFLDNVFEEEGGTPAMRPCPDVQSSALRRMLRSIATELAAPSFASDVIIQAALIGSAVELARHIGIGLGPDRAGRPGSRQIRIIMDYIVDNLDGDLRIITIAHECGVSPRHLTRLFKTETGRTIGDYIAESRIAMAKDMLCMQRQSIKEVSWRCGFQSPSAFSAAFRAATGATPRTFRESRLPG